MKIWNKLVFGDVNLKVDQCLEALDTIQMQLASDGYSDDLHNKEAFAQIDLQQALNYQEQFWKDKSSLNWHLYGDRNTSFFHKVTKPRHASRSMSVLKNGDVLIDDADAMVDHVIEYFSGLYTTNNDCSPNNLIEQVVPYLVSEEDNVLLTAMLSHDEIKSVVFAMNGDRAPGPDGFGGCFFQALWEIVRKDVCNSVCQFFS